MTPAVLLMVSRLFCYNLDNACALRKRSADVDSTFIHALRSVKNSCELHAML